MTSSSTLLRLAFGLTIFLTLGCGGSDEDPMSNGLGESPSLESLTLSTTTPTTLARVNVLGVTAALRAAGDLGLLIVGHEDLGQITVGEDSEGDYILAPFHPDTPSSGGPVRVRFTLEESLGPEIAIEVAPLPAAPGAFAELIEALTLSIEGRASRAGTSIEALRALTLETVENRLFPLKYAQTFLDDPGNANSLTAIANGSSSLLSADERELLDQISRHSQFTALLALDHGALVELDPPASDKDATADPARRTCIDVGLSISSAAELSAAMWEAKFADIAISGDAGNTLSALSATLAGGALIPGAGGAFTVLGAGVASYQAAQQFYAGMNPSFFKSITAVIDRTQFNEDSEELGNYSNVQIVAASTGWNVDQAIFDAITTVIGAAGSASQANAISQSVQFSDAAAAGLNQVGSNYLGSQPDGIVQFCAQEWTVDISSPIYCEARSVLGKLQVATGAQTYRPAATGEGILKISNVASKFGQEQISTDKSVTVTEIVVRVVPSRIEVRSLGETVDVDVSIMNADDQKLYWDAGAGDWDDGLLQLTNGPMTRKLKTPTSRSAYPFLVTVESFSRKGLRASGTPERKGSASVVLVDEIVVSPANACLDPSEIEPFTALQADEPADVFWSLETEGGAPSSFGFISSAGVYTAPTSGSGRVLVVATSQENSEIRGTALVEVGVCECFWALTIEGDGAWSGTFASHAFPSFTGFFSFTIGDPTGEITGSVQAFTDPVTEGQTGVFMPEGFAFATQSRVWVATSDPEDATPFSIFIDKNNTATLQGSVEGTCLTVIGGEEFKRGFTLNFRSGNLGSGEEICGGQ